MMLALVIGCKYEAMRDYLERYMGKVKRVARGGEQM